MINKWNKRDLLIYPLVLITTGLAYFTIVSTVKHTDQPVKITPTPTVPKKQLSIDDNVLFLTNIADSSQHFGDYLQKIKNKGNRAFVVLDGGCSVCLKTLMSWKTLIDEEHLDQQRIIFIGYDASVKQLNFTMNKIAGLKCPMFEDNRYAFGSLNGIGQDSDLKNLVTDQHGQILVQGDPFKTQKTKNIFIQYLKS